MSARRCGSICPILRGAPRCRRAAALVALLAVLCANVIHIAPWRVAEEPVCRCRGGYLRPDGRMFLYGPFKRDGKHTARQQCGVRHQSARQQLLEWGVRDIADVKALAGESVGLKLTEIAEMPANNLILSFERR